MANEVFGGGLMDALPEVEEEKEVEEKVEFFSLPLR